MVPRQARLSQPAWMWQGSGSKIEKYLPFILVKMDMHELKYAYVLQ
jgi:hypothetical protein